MPSPEARHPAGSRPTWPVSADLWLQRVEQLLAGGLVLGIFALTAIQVFARHVMQEPFTWTEEIARYALVTLTFIGAALAMARRAHIVVSFTAGGDAPRRGWRRWPSWLAGVGTAVGFALLAGFAVVNARALSGIGSSATGFPLALLYSLAAVGLGLAAVHALLQVLGADRDRAGDRAGDRANEPDLRS